MKVAAYIEEEREVLQSLCLKAGSTFWDDDNEGRIRSKTLYLRINGSKEDFSFVVLKLSDGIMFRLESTRNKPWAQETKEIYVTGKRYSTRKSPPIIVDATVEGHTDGVIVLRVDTRREDFWDVVVDGVEYKQAKV